MGRKSPPFFFFMTLDQTNTDKKWCSKCQQWKEKSEFSKNRVRPDGLQNYCKPCAYAAHRGSIGKHRDEINAANQRKRLSDKIERTYGMTLEEYELLVFDQNDQCPICHLDLGEAPIPFKDGDSIVCVALLCDACGAGLRFFEQSTDRLFRAISFLDSFNPR